MASKAGWSWRLIISGSGFDSRLCCKKIPPDFFHNSIGTMKVIFTILLILIGTFAVVGQALEHIELDATPSAYDTLRAPNILEKDHVLTAVYPTLTVSLYFREHKLRIWRVDDLGDTHTQTFDALVTQVTGWTYRAQVTENTFVEINAAEGTTYVHQHCQTRSFEYTRPAERQ